MGVPGLDEEATRQEETFLVALDFGPDGPQPPARGKCFKQFVSGVGGISHILSCSPQGPGEMADCNQSPSLPVE